MSSVPTPPPAKPSTPPPTPKAGAAGDAAKNANAAPDTGGSTSGLGGPGAQTAKNIKDAGKQAKAAESAAAPKLSDAATPKSPEASKNAPAFDKSSDKPKSNLPETPKEPKQDPKQQNGPQSSKDQLKDQREARGSGGDAADSKGPEDKPKSAREAKADAAKEGAKKAAADGVEQALDSAAGGGATKDLKNMVAKEDKNGDKIGADERAISAAKNVGRAANIIWGGRNEAINTAIDKVGDGLSAAARFKKRKKREMKEAVSGKAMMDAAMTDEARKNLKRKKADGIGKSLDGKKGKNGKDSESKQNASGDAEAGGSGIVKKALAGVAIAVVGAIAVTTFLLGGQIEPYDGQPDEESDESVMEYVPGGEEGWHEVATWSVSHQNWDRPPSQVPWTVIMGLAYEQTELGRFSPYDSEDRDPDREASPILPGGGGGGGGHVGGDVNIQNTGDMDRTNPAWRQQIAMEGLVNSGWTPEQAAGMVGNMITESGVEPTKAEIGKAFPSTWGWGLVQWTFDRNTTVVEKVKSDLGAKFYTNDPNKLTDEEWISLMELELSHVNWEFENTHSHVGDAMEKAKTAEEASNVFLEKFEIPADIPGNRPTRAAQSKEVLKMYEAGGVDAIASGNVSVNTTQEEAEYLTFHTDDTVRTEMVGTRGCAVENPDPEIGGGEGEGVGPYLLTPAAAEKARDSGYDPQSPCVGRWIADQLGDVTGTVGQDNPELVYHDDAPWPYGDLTEAPAGGGGDGSGGGNAGTGETGAVQYPVSRDIPTTSPFGWRVHPVTGEKKFHNGLDFGADGGTSIGAVADGVVKENISKPTGYGNHVILSHTVDGEEVTSLYAHMEAQSPLKVGDKVKAGDEVGKVGTSGTSTGNHLHLEITINGERTDPAPWLEKHAGSGGDDNTSATQQDQVVTGNVSGSDDEESEDEGEKEDDEKSPDVGEGALDEEAQQKYQDNIDYWEAVIAGTGIFADKNATSDTCELSGGSGDGSDEAYSQQIIYSFHCEIAKNGGLQSVERAYFSSPPSDADEDEIKDFEATPVFQTMKDLYDQEVQIINEALQVSYTATEWDLEECAADADRAGLFSLTAEEMQAAGYQAEDRCDSAKSAAAAAKLFVEGEGTAVDDRPTDDGEFQPALGGWDNISIAVGTDDRADFLLLGNGSDSTVVSDKCYASMEDWVTHVARNDKGSDEGETGFSDFADLADLSAEERLEKVRLGTTWSDEMIKNGFIEWGGKRTPPHINPACNGGSADSYMEQLGEVASDLAHDEKKDERKKALQGYANWTSWNLNLEGLEPTVGKSALVQRLTPYSYNYPELPLGHDALSLAIMDELGGRDGHIPIDQRGVEYAIFLGGLSKPFDSAGQIYGSLREASGSSGGSTGGGGNDNPQTEVDAEGCPTEPGPLPQALSNGSDEIGINELCKRAIEGARNPETAEALKWAFQQVGVAKYSQPRRMENGFADCSSLVTRAYKEGAGVDLYEDGANAWSTQTFRGNMQSTAPTIPQKEMMPGDYWMQDTGHVTFWLTDGYVLSASSSAGVIRIQKNWTGGYNVGGYIDVDSFK